MSAAPLEVVVPPGWEFASLGSLGRFRKGRGIARSDIRSEGIPCVRYGEIYTTHSHVIRRFASFIDDEASRRAEPLKHGDVVFTTSGETLAEIGKSVAYVGETGAAFVGGDTAILSPLAADSTFLGYALEHPSVTTQKAKGGQGDAVAHTSASRLAQVELLLPPLEEQQRIAGVLSDVDDLLDSLDALIVKKRAVKDAVMGDLLTGRRRLPGFDTGAGYQTTEVGDIPADWKVAKLGHLAQMRSGGTPKTDVSGYYGGDIPWASISDMTEAGRYLSRTSRTLTEQGLRASSAVIYHPPVVLYAMYASMGEVCMASVPTASSQAILGIQAGDQLDFRFLYFLLANLKGSVAQLGQQGTQSNLNKEIVQSLPIALPSVEEQCAVADLLMDMDDELDVMVQERTKVADVKAALMDELLTGRTRLL